MSPLGSVTAFSLALTPPGCLARFWRRSRWQCRLNPRECALDHTGSCWSGQTTVSCFCRTWSGGKRILSRELSLWRDCSGRSRLRCQNRGMVRIWTSCYRSLTTTWGNVSQNVLRISKAIRIDCIRLKYQSTGNLLNLAYLSIVSRSSVIINEYRLLYISALLTASDHDPSSTTPSIKL